MRSVVCAPARVRAATGVARGWVHADGHRVVVDYPEVSVWFFGSIFLHRFLYVHRCILLDMATPGNAAYQRVVPAPLQVVDGWDYQRTLLRCFRPRRCLLAAVED